MKINVKSWIVGCAAMAAVSHGLPAQTHIDLRTQTKSADLSSVGATKPAQTGATLPSTCNAGEVFFLTSAAAGANLMVCASLNQWSNSGSLATQAGGTPAGTATTLNLLPGTNITQTVTCAAGTCSYQPDVDTTQLPTNATIQAGQLTSLTTTSSSPGVFTAVMAANDPLPAYVDGQQFIWINGSTGCAGGAMTMNIDGLGAAALYAGPTGTTSLTSAQCGANAHVPLIYDAGTLAFRAPSASSGSTGTITGVTVAGTTNEIAATGTCTGTTTISCTFSLPAGLTIPGTINGLSITTTTGTLSIAGGKTLTLSNSLTLAGTDNVTLTFPSSDATMARTDAAQTFTGVQTFSSTIVGGVSGNSSTATALAATPGLCSTGQAPTGILANGNATGCAPPATSLAISAAPAVTTSFTIPTANILTNTDNLGAWTQDAMLVTEGQTAEDGTPDAILAEPGTTNSTHSVSFNPITACGGSSCNLSIYAAPAGYNYLSFGYEDGGVYHVNGFLLSNCTVVMTASGDTNTATTVGSGPWCRLSISFTISSSVAILFVSPSDTSGHLTGTFSGSGTSGAYLSHPQLSATSAVQTYQPTISGWFHYCQAAYNSAGVSSGCSQVMGVQNGVRTLNSASYNTIVTAPVTGADHCAVFRWGFPGAGNISGSITCGSTVVDTGLAGDGATPPQYNLTGQLNATLTNGSSTAFSPYTAALGMDNRKLMVQSVKSQLMSSPASFQRIFYDPPGSAGTIVIIHASFTDLPSNLQINIVCNQAAQPGIQLLTQDLGGFRSATVFNSGNLLVDANGSGEYSFSRKTEINYTNGCEVDLYDASSSSTVYAEVTARQGFPSTYASRAVWHANAFSSSATQYQTVNLLPTVTGAGELESVQLSVGTNTSLEGNPFIYSDGQVALTANGTEDFFGGGFYCSNESFASERWGCFGAAFLYRFFTAASDRLVFNSSLQITWENGLQTQGSPGTQPYAGLVTYWTTQ